ncbi:hypothetical protein PM082_023733 [Marasmius tenuissimus]|nr:hypothetical protein PM082_023733 [Marasmius tenuissimus]
MLYLYRKEQFEEAYSYTKDQFNWYFQRRMAGLYHFIHEFDIELRNIDAVPASEEDRRILDAALSLPPLPQPRAHSGNEYLSEAEVEGSPAYAGIPPRHKHSWTDLSQGSAVGEAEEREKGFSAKRQQRPS